MTSCPPPTGRYWGAFHLGWSQCYNSFMDLRPGVGTRAIPPGPSDVKCPTNIISAENNFVSIITSIACINYNDSPF